MKVWNNSAGAWAGRGEVLLLPPTKPNAFTRASQKLEVHRNVFTAGPCSMDDTTALLDLSSSSPSACPQPCLQWPAATDCRCAGFRSCHFKHCTLTNLETILHMKVLTKVTSSAAMAPYHHPTLPNSLFSPHYSSLTGFNWPIINKSSLLQFFSEIQMSFTIPFIAVASSAQL